MRLTIELNNLNDLEKVMQMLKSLQIQEVNVFSTNSSNESPNIRLGDKSIDPKALFGIWEDAPRSLTEIRSKSWTRNWKL